MNKNQDIHLSCLLANMVSDIYSIESVSLQFLSTQTMFSKPVRFEMFKIQ